MSLVSRFTHAPRKVFIDLSASGVIKIVDDAVLGPFSFNGVSNETPTSSISLLNVLPNSSFFTFPIKAAVDPKDASPTAVLAAEPPEMTLGELILSKRNFDKKWNLPFGTRNNYNYERIDNTVFIGQIEPGMTVQLNAFKQIDENYEKYETEFYKTWNEKGILNGSRRWWEFNKLLSSSENANKDITHVTIDIQGQELSEEEQQKLWETVTFTDQMMWQNGTKTRELVGQATLELIDFRN